MATCPQAPSVPQEVLQRFRTMRDYDKQMRNLVASLCAIIPDPTDLTDILDRLAALEAAGSGSTDCCDDLYAHIASTVVHGTVSDVVGESDTQDLDNKTIGFTSPGYGRFTHCLQSNRIAFTETLDVPSNYNMVNAGTYIIDGTLTVSGTAEFL